MDDLRLGTGGVLVAVALLAGTAAAAPPVLTVVHEHTEHTGSVTDVAVGEASGTVWSLDETGGFVGYDADSGSVTTTAEFGIGHALAVGNGSVYVGENATLWEYDVAADKWRELASMGDHAAAIEYDPARDVVWTTGARSVYGYHAGNGSLFASHSQHTDGTSDLAIHGEYVASGTTWDDEVLVYSVAEDRVVYEPEFPDYVRRIGALSFTDGGDLLVGTESEGGSLVGLYDVEAEQRVTGYREHVFGVSEVVHDAERDRIVSTGVGNRIVFFDLETDSVVATYDHDDTIYTAALDGASGLLWFGDGEETDGRLIGLDVSDPTPTPTAEPTTTPTAESTPTAEPTASPTAEATDGSTPEEADGPATTPTGTATSTGGEAATNGDGATGLAPALGALAVVSLASAALRRRGS